MKPIPAEIHQRLLDPTPLTEMEVWRIQKAAGTRRVFLQWANAIARAGQAAMNEAEALTTEADARELGKGDAA